MDQDRFGPDDVDDEGLVVEDPRTALLELKDRIRPDDRVVLLTSMDFEEVVRLMKGMPWIDLALSTMVVGNPIADAEKPLEVLRTIHSFDPCIACAVHVTDPEGEELVKVKVV